MVFGDYHTHTTFSDGKSSIEKNIAIAKERGLKEICISDHGYFTVFCGMTDKKWSKQSELIDKQNDIKVLHGIESNIISDGTIDVDGKNLKDIDVLTVGFHRFIGVHNKQDFRFIMINGFASKKTREKEIENNTKAFVHAINTYPIDILAHINNRTLVDVKLVCEECAKNNTYVELNAKHLDSIENCINDMIESSCNFIVSTDSHKAKEVGEIKKIEAFIEKHDVPKDRVYGLDKAPIFKEK